MVLLTIPTQNCVADCLTKISAKADNVITAVKTRRLPDVDIHPDLRTLMEHKAFLSTWCRTFMFTREKEVFFLNTLKSSLAPPTQEGSFEVMFVATHHTQEQQDLKTCESESQNATRKKKKSALTDSCIQSPWPVMSML